MDPTPDSKTVTTATPTMATTTTSVKSGWRTTEFWLALAAKVLGVLTTTGILGDGTQAMRIAGLAVVVLASMGYSYSRGAVKAAA